MDRKIGREIRLVNNLLRRRFEMDLRQFVDRDVTVIHVWILKYIAESEPKEVFQKDIEKEFRMAKSTATGTLKLMESKGLVTRDTVAYDERLKRLSLTDKGRLIARELWERAKKSDSELIRGIDAERLEIFYSVLDEIKKNAETQKDIERGEQNA